MCVKASKSPRASSKSVGQNYVNDISVFGQKPVSVIPAVDENFVRLPEYFDLATGVANGRRKPEVSDRKARDRSAPIILRSSQVCNCQPWARRPAGMEKHDDKKQGKAHSKNQ